METHQLLPPPTPAILSGLQVNPTGTLRSPTTMPSKPSREAASLLPAGCTLLQHCTFPVLHCDTLLPPPWPESAVPEGLAALVVAEDEAAGYVVVSADEVAGCVVVATGEVAGYVVVTLAGLVGAAGDEIGTTGADVGTSGTEVGAAGDELDAHGTEGVGDSTMDVEGDHTSVEVVAWVGSWQVQGREKVLATRVSANKRESLDNIVNVVKWMGKE